MKIVNLMISVTLIVSTTSAVGQEAQKKFKKVREEFLIDRVQIFKKFYTFGSYHQLKAGFAPPGAASGAVDVRANAVSQEFDAKQMSNIMSNAVVSDLIPHKLTGIQLAGQFSGKGLVHQVLIMTSGSVIIDLSHNQVFRIINEKDRKYVADLVAKAISKT